VNKDCRELKVILEKTEMMAKKEILDFLDQLYVVSFKELQRFYIGFSLGSTWAAWNSRIARKNGTRRKSWCSR
jgi:hypothetical protein